MEFYPVKIDWGIYEESLAKGEFLPSVCLLKFGCEDPPDDGSLNAALSDFFPVLRPHLPTTVCDAIGPLIGAIATCGVRGWPPPKNGPKWLYDNSRDLHDIQIGNLFSPVSVSKIVGSFSSVPVEAIMSATVRAWTLKSNKPSKYKYATIDHFPNSEDFLEYLLAWYAPFQEAATEGHGIGIGAC